MSRVSAGARNHHALDRLLHNCLEQEQLIEELEESATLSANIINVSLAACGLLLLLMYVGARERAMVSSSFGASASVEPYSGLGTTSPCAYIV